jgi:uncharacterized protein YcbK (DUF882 family)
MLKDYFPEEPFRCRDGCGLDAFDSTLRSILNQARECFGRPIIINSGCRCKKRNQIVGGAKHSAHLSGPDGFCHAVDIRVFSDITRARLHKIFYDLGIRRFEVSDLHIHVDRADFYLPSPILASVNFKGVVET